MNNFITALSTHDTFTENWAVTNSTSLNYVLDLFFIAGASRGMPEDSILKMWDKAYIQNPELALKCLFYARDIRGWLGERRFFRTIWNYLDSSITKKFEHLVPEYGRWDDLFETSIDYIVNCISNELKSPTNQLGLLAKWMPRKWLVFNKVLKGLRKKYPNMNITSKFLRKFLVNNSSTVEQLMCSNQWEQIIYDSVPWNALLRYSPAFLRHDKVHFIEFLKQEWSSKMSTIFPHQIYQLFKKQGVTKEVINKYWNELPNYISENTSFLPVCDVSGSMSGLPMLVSVSLWIYLSERNKSSFKDAFITFSENPKLHYLQWSLTDRFSQLEYSDWADWGLNTDLHKVFTLILKRAKETNLDQSDLPTHIIIISDMEFDQGVTDETNYEVIKREFKDAWYVLPKVVFWNVRGRDWNVPVTSQTKNTLLVSGFTPSIMKHILTNTVPTPEGLMLEVLTQERYNCISLEK